MNIFYKVGCRMFQGVMYVALRFLNIREPKVVKGEDCIKELPSLIKTLNLTKPLIVTDKVLKGLGMIDGLENKLKEEKLEYAIYDNTVPNTPIENVMEGYNVYNTNKCDCIIAFGGGSPIDCAKAIGCKVARPNKEVAKMKGVLKVNKKLPTLFAIPTTAGTGSECTLAAVVSNPSTHEKFPINDPVIVPSYAILDPLVTKGLPKHITSTTGMDALTHAIEAYIGSENTRKTKIMALDAVKLVFENILEAYNNPSNLIARNNMQLAAYKAGYAFTRAYVGNVHAIAHTISGFYNMPHGLCCAVVLPHILDFYGPKSYKKLAQLADNVNIKGKDDKEKALKFIKAIKKLNKDMEIPTGFKEIKEEDIALMAKRALAEANPLYPVPVIMDKDSMYKMYKELTLK